MFTSQFSHFVFISTLALSVICGMPVQVLSQIHPINPNTQSYRVQYFSNDNGLPQNSIKGLAFDEFGNLWIGTEGGIACYNGQEIKKDFEIETFKRIAYVKATKDQKIYILDGAGKTFRINGKSLSLLKIDQERNHPHAYYWYISSGNSNLEVLNKVFRADKHFQYIVISSAGEIYQLGDNHDLYLVEDQSIKIELPQGRKKVTVLDDLVMVLDSFQFHFLKQGKVLKSTNLLSGDLPSDVNIVELLNAFYFQSEGKTYAVLRNSLFHLNYQNEKLNFRTIFSGLPELAGINSAVYSSANEMLILGSYTNGMVVIQPSPFKSIVAENFILNPGSNSGISNNIMSQLLQEDTSIIASNGLKYKKDGYTQTGLPELFPYHLFNDTNNNLWYSLNHKYTLVRQNPDSKIAWTRKFPYYVFDIKELPDNAYLLAESTDLYLLDKNDSIKLLNSISKFGKMDIYKVFDFSSTHYWVATDRGVYTFDKKNYKLESIPELDGKYVRTIIKTIDQNIWIGTYGDGYYLHYQNQFHKMPLDRNQSLLFAHHFEPDSKGYLWISTNNGLFQVLESDLVAYVQNKNSKIYFQNYDKTYGFSTNEFNGGGTNPGLTTQDGMISLASLNGLVWFYPEKVKPVVPDKPIYITSYTIDSIFFDSVPKPIILEPDFLRITMNVSTPFFGNPQNLLIEFRLIGQDTTWRHIDKDKIIKFDNLRHGNYKLQLRKQNGFGVNNYTYLEQEIIVKPYFYNTSLFYILIAGLLIVILTLTWNRMVKGYQSQKDKLEKNIIERSENLAVTVDELKKITQQNEMLLGILVHDVKAPLSFTHDLIKNLDFYWHDINEEEKRMYISELSKSTLKLSIFMQEFLTWMTLQQGVNIFAGKNPVYIKHVFTSVTEFMEMTGANKENRILLNMEGNLTLKSNSQLVEIIVRNIVENACKYTEAGVISLSAIQIEDQICIICEDNGQGITESEIQTLLEQKDTEADFSSSFKMGYQVILKILDRLNGKIEITSELGVGTKVKIFLPRE
jgi:signal transduction histidine kinase